VYPAAAPKDSKEEEEVVEVGGLVGGPKRCDMLEAEAAPEGGLCMVGALRGVL
jgi:hypothetical protein